MTTASSYSFPFGTFDADAFSNFFPNSDTIGPFARGAVEASTETTRASVKGMQEAGHTMMAHLKQHMNLSVEAGKKLSEAGSFEDALSIQTGFMKSAFENNLKGFSDLSEVYAETMRDAFAPLAKQAKKTARRAKTA